MLIKDMTLAQRIVAAIIIISALACVAAILAAATGRI
jgi:hypothetical protein